MPDYGLLHCVRRRRSSPCLHGPSRRHKDLERGRRLGPVTPAFASLHHPRHMCSERGRILPGRWRRNGPGLVGYPLPGVSCLSTSFCVTTTDGQLAVGKEPG